MADSISISFIGSGNLAWHLAPALDNRGFIVREVYSKNPHHAELLTERLYQAEVKATLDFSTSNSKVFFICVSDDAIAEVAREIIIPEDAIVVHSSGSQPLSALQYVATNHIGVFYPLQTFSKSKKTDFKSIPVFIECYTEAESLLIELAKSISHEVRKIGSEERKALHLAAVFASNFTNHMLTIARKIMAENNLDYNWLQPLIAETINKSLTIGPEKAQTGPAMRGDLEVLDNHIAYLAEHEPEASIYKAISQHIIDNYQIE